MNPPGQWAAFTFPSPGGPCGHPAGGLLSPASAQPGERGLCTGSRGTANSHRGAGRSGRLAAGAWVAYRLSGRGAPADWSRQGRSGVGVPGRRFWSGLCTRLLHSLGTTSGTFTRTPHATPAMAAGVANQVWSVEEVAPSMKRRAVFLDLNGTLVMPILVEHPQQLVLIDGATDAIARLSGAGFVCPVVTVQSRIEKGVFSAEGFTAWFAVFRDLLGRHGADVVGPYVCPHRFANLCPCKKPNTLLYERAAADHAIDLRRSFVVGDSAADMEAASRFGGQGCLVRTGWGADDGELERATPYLNCVAQSLGDAVAWILRTR